MDLTRSERTYRRWLDAATDGEIPRSVPPKIEPSEVQIRSERAEARPVQILNDYHPPLADQDLQDFEKFSNTPLPEPFRFYLPPEETPAQTQNGGVVTTTRRGALSRSNAVSKRSSQISELNLELRGGFERASFYSQGSQSAVPQSTAKSDCGPSNPLQLHLLAPRGHGDMLPESAKSELVFMGLSRPLKFRSSGRSSGGRSK